MIMQPRATPAEMMPTAIQSLRLEAVGVVKAMIKPATRQAMVATTANNRIGDQ
jgi:hypothetical protein